MKCTNCKETDVIWDDRIMRMNPAGKTIYDFSIGHCPQCHIRYEVDNMGTKGKPKESSLGIVSFVLTLFGLTIPIGFVLALVDLIKGNKAELHTYAIISIIVVVCIFVLLLAVFLSNIS